MYFDLSSLYSNGKLYFLSVGCRGKLTYNYLMYRELFYVFLLQGWPIFSLFPTVGTTHFFYNEQWPILSLDICNNLALIWTWVSGTWLWPVPKILFLIRLWPNFLGKPLMAIFCSDWLLYYGLLRKRWPTQCCNTYFLKGIYLVIYC